ncbi:nuclear pore complex protein Nup107 [Condylostylus longicornis]|uniref:nuclear pore complex protein Nup107 n=1 Tax=Condylostylus longicornis TaxID=2530218 RepID=UPI00244DB869|nr:nuclear pore complex protein Nup107 [Condylostylus longicornis]
MFLNKTGGNFDLNTTKNKTLDNISFLSGSLRDFGNSKIDNISVKEKTNSLFAQFLDLLQNRGNEAETFDTIQEMTQTLSSIFEEIKPETVSESNTFNEYEWLRKERDTWKLFHALYHDRIIVQKSEIEEDFIPLGTSEKAIVSQLYLTNANLREYQLVVDWLEACAAEKNIIEIGHFTDRKVGWENTLYQLKNPGSVAFTSHVDIVKHMDPDVSTREKKPLHPLDMEDDVRLVRAIFSKIRQGKIEDAKSLCVYCGQPWRAATLEGWRLYEDPNYEQGNKTELLPIEGNPRRDLWKSIAFRMADSTKYDSCNRAIYGSLCGHLESLLNILQDSWEDLLWAYMKVQIDIRVESEIRSCCIKNYVEMPEKYWNSKMTLEQIFQELSVHKNPAVRQQSASKINIIQKHLILDNIDELLEQMRFWVEQEKISPQMLRLFAHIVIFLRQMGRVRREAEADCVIKEYVESLILMKEPQLVAFYVAALPVNLQIILYSKFLEGIKETQERFEALEEASSAGLDVESITTYTVRVIRNIEQPPSDLLKTEISEVDEVKISALEWLTFYPQQRGELLYQANAVIRNFLAEGKIECVRKAIKMIPNDSIDQTVSNCGTKEGLLRREECSIKEYLCHQTYLAAIDGFNDWMHLYHNRPKEPQSIKSNATFTEKMAMEHKEQTFRAEMARWNLNLQEQSRVTRDLLFNVLLFPDKGWLVDPDSDKLPPEILDEWQLREVQLENLRKLCIPEIVLLLIKVLHSTGEYADCVKLVDEIASEHRQLYKVYPKHKLAELLAKVAESSLALMNEKLDPWGYKINI